NRLPIAVCRHRQKSGEGIAFGSRVNRTTGGAAADSAGDMTGVFAPIAEQLAAGVGDVGVRLEFVAVAGESQLLLQVVAATLDRIRPVTTNALVSTVFHRDHTGALPDAGETLEGPGDGFGHALLRVRLGAHEREPGGNRDCRQDGRECMDG